MRRQGKPTLLCGAKRAFKGDARAGLTYIAIMTDTSETPEPTEAADSAPAETQVSTAPKDSALPVWLTSLPPALQPYVALSRLDRPVGIWLLLLPCWIGVVFTTVTAGFNIYFPLWIVLFAIGAIAMRGAGCTWNDITDREIDAGVERTAARPLPSGQVSLMQAYAWLGAQVFVGFLVWLCLPLDAKIVAFLAIPLVVAYPFMKRVTWWPQAWLGMTFNWGVLVAAATVASVSLSSVILWLGLACWTVAYDTIYALQDVEDDELMGVKSTARLFGERAVLGAFCFHLAAGAIIGLASLAIGAEQVGGLTAIAFIAHGVWQVWMLRKASTRNPLAVFKSNVWAGAIPVVGFLIAALL
ncbi:MAG: UbiA family prenyltransferase [Hyphomonadaceae bacterium]|nr:UbiA family prenyltransferase [Hyphomonadaceae bacterium]